MSTTTGSMKLKASALSNKKAARTFSLITVQLLAMASKP